MAKGVLNTHGNLASATEMIRMVGEPLDANRIALSRPAALASHLGRQRHLNGAVRVAGSLYMTAAGRCRAASARRSRTCASSRRRASARCRPPIRCCSRRSSATPTCGPGSSRTCAGWAMAARCCRRRASIACRAWRPSQLGERLPFGCGWGMTETTSTGLMVYWNVDRAGLLGLPQPGMLAKLVPAGDRYELRVKGPNVMPGYYAIPRRRPRRSTRKVSSGPAMPRAGSTRAGPKRALPLLAACWRSSSSPRAPGCAPRPCARS